MPVRVESQRPGGVTTFLSGCGPGGATVLNGVALLHPGAITPVFWGNGVPRPRGGASLLVQSHSNRSMLIDKGGASRLRFDARGSCNFRETGRVARATHFRR